MKMRVFVLASGVALAAAAAASGAAWYPGYYVTQLAPVPGSGANDGAQGWSLLSNGTVVGATNFWWDPSNPTTPPFQRPCLWNSNGAVPPRSGRAPRGE